MMTSAMTTNGTTTTTTTKTAGTETTAATKIASTTSKNLKPIPFTPIIPQPVFRYLLHGHAYMDTLAWYDLTRFGLRNRHLLS